MPLSLLLVQSSRETLCINKQMTAVLLPTQSVPFSWQSFLMSIPYECVELLHSSVCVI